MPVNSLRRSCIRSPDLHCGFRSFFKELLHLCITRTFRILFHFAVGVAVVVYFVLVIRMGAVNEAELKSFPKGAMLVHIAKKMHLLR